MRSFRWSNLKLISMLLIGLLLIQNCVIYHKESATVQQAIEHDNRSDKIIPYKVKIILNDDKKLKLDSLYYRNDELYGLIYYSEYGNETEINEMKISIEDIKEIHLLNRKGSKILTIVLAIVSGIYLGIAIYALIEFKDFERELDIWP